MLHYNKCLSNFVIVFTKQLQFCEIFNYLNLFIVTFRSRDYSIQNKMEPLCACRLSRRTVPAPPPFNAMAMLSMIS